MRLITRKQVLSDNLEILCFPADSPWWIHCIEEMQRTYMMDIDEIYVPVKYIILLKQIHGRYARFEYKENTGKRDFKLCGMKLAPTELSSEDLVVCIGRGQYGDRKVTKHFRIKLIEEDLNGVAFLHKSIPQKTQVLPV